MAHHAPASAEALDELAGDLAMAVHLLEGGDCSTRSTREMAQMCSSECTLVGSAPIRMGRDPGRPPHDCVQVVPRRDAACACREGRAPDDPGLPGKRR